MDGMALFGGTCARLDLVDHNPRSIWDHLQMPLRDVEMVDSSFPQIPRSSLDQDSPHAEMRASWGSGHAPLILAHFRLADGPGLDCLLG